MLILDLQREDIKYGLISEERFKKFEEKRKQIEDEIQRLRDTIIKPSNKVNEFLVKCETTPIDTGIKLSELLKRTELTYKNLSEIDEKRPYNLQKDIIKEVEIELKYEGYIKMQEQQVIRFKKLEEKSLKEEIDYEKIKGLSLEARQKLNRHKPTSVGQASRISGVSPADISVLLIYLEQNKRREKV